MCKISELIGKTVTQLELSKESDALYFYCSDGSIYLMYHEQDCCESVSIDDITGDLSDLLQTPIIMANEVSNSNETSQGSETWTFYNLGTIKGYVTLRWYGESNGYYSESVDFKKIKEAH